MKINPKDAPPLPDAPIVWRCKCGATNFVHHTYCGRCGNWPPAPAPVKAKR